MPSPIITKGLKFTSVTFNMKAEIVDIREDENAVDVILTSTNGDTFRVNNWSLLHLQDQFDKGKNKEIESNQVNISVF